MLGYLRNVQDAEDVVQEATIKVLTVLMEEEDKTKQFREESTLKTWIYKIAINRAKDKIRQQNQKKRKGERREKERKNKRKKGGKRKEEWRKAG